MPIPPTRKERATELYDIGRKALEAGDVEQALSAFAESAALDPHFKTLERLADCFLRLNRPVDAIIPLAAATTLNRGVSAPSKLAKLFFEIGELYDARRLSEVALQRDPNNRLALDIQRKTQQIQE
jgi:tetratricopeptide (TPR) repeat protein